MKLLEHVNLALYSTMRLGGTARYVCEISSRDELLQSVAWAAEHKLEILMIGGGSNIVWSDQGFDGLLVVNKIGGYHESPKRNGSILVTVGAGENWDKVVARSAASGLSGIEALSLIPGSAGATPVQNVGAYGQDVSDTLVNVEAYDRRTGQFVSIAAADCQFGYRSSRFKTTDRGRFFIVSLTFALQRRDPGPPFYRALEDYFAAREIKHFTPQIVRDAVIDIRSHKLPDPALVANNGSFFANPVIDAGLAAQLSCRFPGMPQWPTDDPGQVKIPAAWLIEQAGFKDYHDAGTGMATWAAQPLVLVNEQARSTADLISFRDKIITSVLTEFSIRLEQEPELLPLAA